MGLYGLKGPFTPSDADSSWFQKFYFSLNLVMKAELKINGVPLKPGEEFIVHAASGSGQGTNAKVSDLGYGLENDYKKFKGNAAMIREGVSADLSESDKAKYKDEIHPEVKFERAIRNKAVMVMLRRKKLTADFSNFPLEEPLIEVLDTCLPKKVKKVSWDIQTDYGGIFSQNVIGWIQGDEFPDSVIILSAHYDHLGKMGNAWFPGANDNASGVTMLLSLAEYFSARKKAGYKLKYSLLFIAFGGEEAGLVGSKFYVQKSRFFPLEKTVFILNLDLMGNGVDGITVVGGTDFPGEFKSLVALNDSLGAVPVVKERANAPNSDHYWFLKNGVKGFFIYTLGGPKWYHDVHDTLENLQFSKFPELLGLFSIWLEQKEGIK
jgi:hypothetical protein